MNPIFARHPTIMAQQAAREAAEQARVEKFYESVLSAALESRARQAPVEWGRVYGCRLIVLPPNWDATP